MLEKAFMFLAEHKEVYRQLHDNPSIEMLGMEGNISVRIRGEDSLDVPEEVGSPDLAVKLLYYRSFLKLLSIVFVLHMLPGTIL
ncbi:MAG: hypothetical protein LIP05_12765 [Tannerellaceae bacterium]|nr:hypothetical protein [Tannerellaceae bacterium]